MLILSVQDNYWTKKILKNLIRLKTSENPQWYESYHCLLKTSLASCLMQVWCTSTGQYIWISRLGASRLSRARIRAPLTAVNHCDGYVWLSPSPPGVCSEPSCQSQPWPDAWAHLQGKSFRGVKAAKLDSNAQEDEQSITKKFKINVMPLF